MAGSEGLGPSPEEIGEPAAPTTPPAELPAEQPPVDTSEQPPEPKGYKDRIKESLDNAKEKRRDKKEKAEIQKNITRARERRIKGYAEVIKHGARSPQELQDLLADISFKDLKEAQDRVKYGSSAIGKFKAYMAGEKDFHINDDESVQAYYSNLNNLRQELGREPSKQEHAERMGLTTEQLEQVHLIEDANTLTEAGRRLVSTFVNRRTAVSAGMYVAMGLVTGGFGWAAGGVLLGGTAFRGAAEMGQLFSGKIREARENVLYAEKARWERMQALALQIRANKEDAGTQGALTKELIDLMHKQGENALVRNLGENEKELSAREAKFNKLRNRMQTTGELLGAAAGITSLLNGGVEKIDMDFFGKLNNQSVFHGVQQTESGWQFLYTSSAEAGKALADGATILGAGTFGAHALEATTTEVVAYTIAERTLPMLLASWLAKGDNIKDSRELLAAMGADRFDNNRFYAKAGPYGKKYIYTREEDGTYKIWEYQESEAKGDDKDKDNDKDKSKAVTKTKKLALVGRAIDEKDVPSRFRERFVDHIGEKQSRNAERLTNQMSDYIRSVADQYHNPIPENPREYNYDWNEQPKSIDGLDPKIDHWYQFVKINGKDEPFADPSTGKLVDVGVLGVDKINNRIAIARYERAANGTEHVPVEIMRLDIFLKNHHLHLNTIAGAPFSTPGEGAPSPDQTGIKNESNDNSEATKDDDPNSSSSVDTNNPTAPTPDELDPEEVRKIAKSEGEKLEEAFLKGLNEDTPPTEPPTPKPSDPSAPKPKNSSETKASKEQNNAEIISFPEDFNKKNKNQRFDWLTDELSGLDPEIIEAANIDYGQHRQDGENWHEWEFIRFQEPSGRERILNRQVTFKAKDKVDSYRFDISTSYPNRNARSHTANVESVELFMRHILKQVNDVIRSGVVIPKTEMQPIEEEVQEPDDPEGKLLLFNYNGVTKIDRTIKKNRRVSGAEDAGRAMMGMRRKSKPETDLDDINDIDPDVGGDAKDETPVVIEPAATRGADFDTSIGARVKGLENLKASLPAESEAPIANEQPAAGTQEQDLVEFLEARHLGPENFTEGQKINFKTDIAEGSQQDAIIQEIRSNLNIPDDQELNSADVSVLLSDGKENDFDITMVRKIDDQDKDYTISLRRLAEVVE